MLDVITTTPKGQRNSLWQKDRKKKVSIRALGGTLLQIIKNERNENKK